MITRCGEKVPDRARNFVATAQSLLLFVYEQPVALPNKGDNFDAFLHRANGLTLCG
jgi:hypothetical protein